MKNKNEPDVTENKKANTRKAGILLAVSSLGADGNKGALGKEAFAFIDFLADAGQSYWQILPIGPVGRALSPYQSRSAFAGNPDFINREAVRQDPGRYAPKGAAYKRFINDNSFWLDDYALFEAVRASQNDTPLYLWPDEIRNPSTKTLEILRDEFKSETEALKLEQFCFFLQWTELKKYANGKGVGIIGDLPIYVYEDSADFWTRRKAFDVDGSGRPASSAGVPPDAFSKDGQIWNNPVYDWEKNRKVVFGFWRDRLIQASRIYDGVRIDHFRAFADYYAIPIGSPAIKKTESGSHDCNVANHGVPQHFTEVTTKASGEPSIPNGIARGAAAINSRGRGEWRDGPGLAFTDMIKKEFPDLFVIAEDLGDLSAKAKKFVKDCGYPGMNVLQFAFSGDPKNQYLPHNIKENSVCYTGTHDNDTTAGWADSAPKKELRFAMEYFYLTKGEDLPGVLIAAALASKSDTAIIPMQDWLGLGSAARMNTPSTVGGANWKWKIPKGALTKRLAKRIRRCTKDLYAR